MVPFVERIGAGAEAIGPTSYRVGYRLESSDAIVSLMEIPAAAVEQTVAEGLSLSTSITPTGEVISALAESRSTSISKSAHCSAEAVDELVARAIDPGNLRDEEAGIAELKMLLARLERSVALVKQALAEIPARS
jgi:hypothetical protein